MVGFAVFGAVAKFCFQFHTGTEVVLQGAPELTVDLIHQWHDVRFVEAVIAEQLAGVSPVFLLDVGVVVFLVRP